MILLKEGASMYPAGMPGRELVAMVGTLVVGIGWYVGLLEGFVSEEDESVREDSMNLAGN